MQIVVDESAEVVSVGDVARLEVTEGDLGRCEVRDADRDGQEMLIAVPDVREVGLERIERNVVVAGVLQHLPGRQVRRPEGVERLARHEDVPSLRIRNVSPR